eukprot:6194233-Pleurochrysis_carterae.AAC.1
MRAFLDRAHDLAPHGRAAANVHVAALAVHQLPQLAHTHAHTETRASTGARTHTLVHAGKRLRDTAS